MNLIQNDPATIQWSVIPVTMPATFSISATVPCASIRAKQLAGKSIPFIVIDSANPNSPVKIAAGGEYNFNSGAGFAANAAVGSISISDATDWPEGHPFIFGFTQR